MTKNTIAYAELVEGARHNREQERLATEAQSETITHNRAQEAESVRSNRAQEALKYAANLETERHQKLQDYIGTTKLKYEALKGATDAVGLLGKVSEGLTNLIRSTKTAR